MGNVEGADGVYSSIRATIRAKMMKSFQEMIPQKMAEDHMKMKFEIPELAEVKKEEEPAKEVEIKLPSVSEPFIMRLSEMDKDAVVDGAIQGGGFKNKLKKFAAKKLVSKEKFQQIIAKKLTEDVPKELANTGMNVEMTQLSDDADVITIRMKIIDVDALGMIASSKGKEYADHLKNLIATMNKMGSEYGVSTMAEKGGEILSNIEANIRQGLATKISATLAEKMHSKVELQYVKVPAS